MIQDYSSLIRIYIMLFMFETFILQIFPSGGVRAICVQVMTTVVWLFSRQQTHANLYAFIPNRYAVITR